MNIEIAKHFYQIVVESYLEYLKVRILRLGGQGQDLRTGLAAAENLYHLREHMPRPFNDWDKINYLLENEDYIILNDLANLNKHNRHDPKMKRKILVKTKEDIKEVFVNTEYIDLKGYYSNDVKELEIHLTDGTTRDLYDVLTRAINFWGKILFEQDIINEILRFEFVKTTYVARGLASSNHWKFSSPFPTKSLYSVTTLYRYQTFDNTTKTALPIISNEPQLISLTTEYDKENDMLYFETGIKYSNQ